MNVRHVILRTTSAATRDPFLGALAAPTVEESVAAGVSVEVDDIDTHDSRVIWQRGSPRHRSGHPDEADRSR